MLVAMAFVVFVPWANGKITNPFLPNWLGVTLVIGLSWGVATAIVALLPCIVAECLGSLLHIHGAWYFITWGMVSAVVLEPVIFTLSGPGTWAARYGNAVVYAAPYFAPGGALCGFIYWRVSRKG